MQKKLLLLSLWFPLTAIVLIFNLSLLSILSRQKNTPGILTTIPFDENFRVAASSTTGRVLGSSVVSADSRALLLTQFLREYDSPMAPYGKLIVDQADEKGIDFRLIVAIAMCESNLGKRMPSSDSYNPFGVAVYTGQQTGATFRNWEEAIIWESNYLKERFYDRGIVDLRRIGEIYAPPSVNTGYSWTNCVETFKNSIL